MLTLELDLRGILSLFEIGRVIRRETQEAAKALSSMTYSKANELAGQRLHSRRKMFVDALSLQEVEPGTWFLQLDARMAWIDDGMDPHSMLDDLLRSPKAKISKDGNRYIVVPFKHNKGPANTPASSMPMVGAVKAGLASRGIPFGKIERDQSGRALLGKLHTVNITDSPMKESVGPGQGWGPINDVRQGPNARQAVGGGPGGGGTPFLKGVSIYQRETPGGGVQRDIMTFRVASDSQRGARRWYHPGTEPVNIFADTMKWAEETWQREILPALMDRIIQGA